MSTKIKGLPPRVALRIKDSATGSYPSIPRTGDDSRRGSYSVRYDDTDTINFLEVSSSSVFSTKRDPKFNLNQNEGNYQSSDRLIHYWQFENGERPTPDTGISGTATLNYLDGNNFAALNTDTPGTGSAFSSGFCGPIGGVWNVSTFAILSQSLTESLSLGDGTSGFDKTFCCWVKKTVALPVTESIIFARSSSVGQGFDSHYEFGLIGTSGGDIDLGEARTESTGSLFFRIFDPSTGGVSEAYLPGFFDGGTASQPDITYNKWWHLAITYSGTFDSRANENSLRFYINGKESESPIRGLLSGSYAAPESGITQATVGGAGSDFGALSRAWRGIIDDFAVFDKVLGPHEIAEIAGFKQGISYPVGLEPSSRFSREIERTDIFAPGTVRKGISDNFISFTPGENITPFNESFRPEQSRTGSFYLTGTDPSASALGFSSKLSSKTQIKFEFDIQAASAMNANTASIVYFNKDSGQFDLVGGEEALAEPAANEERGMAGRDCKLFNAIGMSLMSGTGIPGSGQSPPSPFHGNTSFTIDSAMDQALIFKQPQSVLLNSLFSASIPQRIPLSGVINAPFLLEKAVIELPISSSDGWFNDRTFALTDGTFTFSDLGGPCVTVSLMNQLASDRRELILSATIIPEGDNTSFTRQGSDSILGPAGFASFATPNAVVKSSGEQTVTLEAQPSIANGVIAQTTGGIDFKDAFIGEVSPFCRSFDVGSPSARSFFGKEYTIPRFDNALPTRYDEAIFSGTAHSDLFIFEKQEVSPYLLLPTDELILAVSKYRAVMTSILSRNPTTSSHEFGFPEGTIKMTLYGSLIRENKEFHDTLNQNLTSEAVHEYIHFDNPVIDQFDVEPRSSFSGSYIAEFFTGSMLLSGTYNTGSFFGNGYLDQRRGVRSSIIGTSNTLIDRLPVFFGSSSFRVPKLGFNRATSHFSNSERYFDTLLPRPDQISSIEGADILHDPTLNRNFYLIGRGASFIAANWIESWDMLFPFEAKYANVTRTATPFRDTLSTLNTSLSPLVAQSSQAGLYRPESVNNTAGTVNGTRIMHGAFASSAVLNYLPVPNNILAKSLFSIGDGQYNEPIGISLNAGGIVAYDVLSRGFKYGIMNSSAEKRKWKFRRDRYGQVRDMLEQARDSKIYLEDNGSIISSPVKVRFVDGSGSAVEPENTFASNMSSEATSSLPYFDDISRNRGALPSVVAV